MSNPILPPLPSANGGRKQSSILIPIPQRPMKFSAPGLFAAFCLCCHFAVAEDAAITDESANEPEVVRIAEVESPVPAPTDLGIAAQRIRQIDEAARTGRISPLEGEFLKLVQTRTGDPMARREAIRAWQKENGEALRAEHKARRAAARPTREAERRTAAQHRIRQIDEAARTGRIGALEAAFLKLVQNHEGAPLACREAILAWEAENGAALKAEQEARRVATLPVREEEMQLAVERRIRRIDEAARTGRIGPLEAELLKFLQSHAGDPKALHEAIRTWEDENGDALRVERDASSPLQNLPTNPPDVPGRSSSRTNAVSAKDL